jgi:hypothetical protein
VLVGVEVGVSEGVGVDVSVGVAVGVSVGEGVRSRGNWTLKLSQRRLAPHKGSISDTDSI